MCKKDCVNGVDVNGYAITCTTKDCYRKKEQRLLDAALKRYFPLIEGFSKIRQNCKTLNAANKEEFDYLLKVLQKFLDEGYIIKIENVMHTILKKSIGSNDVPLLKFTIARLENLRLTNMYTNSKKELFDYTPACDDEILTNLKITKNMLLHKACLYLVEKSEEQAHFNDAITACFNCYEAFDEGVVFLNCSCMCKDFWCRKCLLRYTCSKPNTYHTGIRCGTCNRYTKIINQSSVQEAIRKEDALIDRVVDEIAASRNERVKLSAGKRGRTLQYLRSCYLLLCGDLTETQPAFNQKSHTRQIIKLNELMETDPGKDRDNRYHEEFVESDGTVGAQHKLLRLELARMFTERELLFKNDNGDYHTMSKEEVDLIQDLTLPLGPADMLDVRLDPVVSFVINDQRSCGSDTENYQRYLTFREKLLKEFEIESKRWKKEIVFAEPTRSVVISNAVKAPKPQIDSSNITVAKKLPLATDDEADNVVATSISVPIVDGIIPSKETKHVSSARSSKHMDFTTAVSLLKRVCNEEESTDGTIKRTYKKKLTSVNDREADYASEAEDLVTERNKPSTSGSRNQYTHPNGRQSLLPNGFQNSRNSTNYDRRSSTTSQNSPNQIVRTDYRHGSYRLDHGAPSLYRNDMTHESNYAIKGALSHNSSYDHQNYNNNNGMPNHNIVNHHDSAHIQVSVHNKRAEITYQTIEPPQPVAPVVQPLVAPVVQPLTYEDRIKQLPKDNDPRKKKRSRQLGIDLNEIANLSENNNVESTGRLISSDPFAITKNNNSIGANDSHSNDYDLLDEVGFVIDTKGAREAKGVELYKELNDSETIQKCSSMIFPDNVKYRLYFDIPEEASNNNDKKHERIMNNIQQSTSSLHGRNKVVINLHLSTCHEPNSIHNEDFYATISLSGIKSKIHSILHQMYHQLDLGKANADSIIAGKGLLQHKNLSFWGIKPSGSLLQLQDSRTLAWYGIYNDDCCQLRPEFSDITPDFYIERRAPPREYVNVNVVNEHPLPIKPVLTDFDLRHNEEIIARFRQEAERLQEESKYDIATGLLVIEKGTKEAETKTLYQKILTKHEKGFSVPKRKRSIIQDSDDDDDIEEENMQDSDGELDYELKYHRNRKRPPGHKKHLGLWGSKDFEVKNDNVECRNDSNDRANIIPPVSVNSWERSRSRSPSPLPVQNSPFPCPVCNSPFYDRNSLSSHLTNSNKCKQLEKKKAFSNGKAGRDKSGNANNSDVISYQATAANSVVSSDRLQAKGLSNMPSWVTEQSNNANYRDVISGQATAANSVVSSDRLQAKGLSNKSAWITKDSGNTVSNDGRNTLGTRYAGTSASSKNSAKSSKRGRTVIDDDGSDSDSDDSDIGLCAIVRSNISGSEPSSDINSTKNIASETRVTTTSPIRAEIKTINHSKSTIKTDSKPRHTSAPKKTSAIDCIYYAKGYCKNGNTCRFLHINGKNNMCNDIDSATENEGITKNSNDSFSDQLTNFIDSYGRK